MSPSRSSSGSSAGFALGLALLALAAGSARADTLLRPSLSVREGWDSNVYSLEKDERDDTYTQLDPRLEILDRGEYGSSSIVARFRNRIYSDESDRNSFDQFGDAAFDFHVGPQLTLFSTANVARIEGYDAVAADGETVDAGDFLREGNPDLDSSGFSGGARYTFSTRTQLNLSAGMSFRDYTSEDTDSSVRVDYDVLYAGASLDRVLSSRDQASLSFSASLIDYDTQVDRSTEIWNATLGWTRQWSEVWVTSFRGGVRGVRERFDTVQQGPILSATTFDLVSLRRINRLEIEDIEVVTSEPSASATTGVYVVRDTFTEEESEYSTAFTGEMLLRRALPRGYLELGLGRETQPSSGSDGTLDVDTAYVKLFHDFTDRVQLRLHGSLTRTQSADLGFRLDNSARTVEFLSDGNQVFATPVGVICSGGAVSNGSNCVRTTEDALDVRRYSLEATLHWRISRRFSTFLQASFVDQGSHGDAERDEFDRFRGLFGFSYAYDIQL